MRPLGRKATEPPEEDRLGTWADTGYSATDEEAHRNVVYDGSSPVKRTFAVFMNQMKLFAKSRWVVILMFAALLMPAVVICSPDVKDFILSISPGSTAYIGTLLSLLGLMMAFFTAVLCGTQIPREFSDRTAYMSMPLPMTRLEFYVGKYLAGFVLCLGVFLMAFGFAIVLAMSEFDTFFSDQIAKAVAGTVVAIFAYSATAFCVGAFMRRGSALIPMLLMLVVLPFIALSIREDCEWIQLLPCFLPEAVVGTLGALLSTLGGQLMPFFDTLYITDSIWTIAGISLVWGIAAFVLGAIKMMRREM